MSTEKNIATLKETGLSVNLDDVVNDSGMGGKIVLADMAVPFLYTLHSLSPQCNPDSPKYIEGARPGKLYLSVIEKVIDTKEAPLELVFCYYERKLPEWRPREKGGGIVATHSIESDILLKTRPNDKGVPTLPNGNNIVETAYHYVLAHVGDTWYQAIMPLKSTGLKVSRKLNSLISTLKIPNTDRAAPRFLYTWHLTTVKDQKDDLIWYNPLCTLGPIVTQGTYNEAKDFCQIAMKGIISTSLEADTGSEGAAKTTAQHNDEVF